MMCSGIDHTLGLVDFAVCTTLCVPLCVYQVLCSTLCVPGCVYPHCVYPAVCTTLCAPLCMYQAVCTAV